MVTLEQIKLLESKIARAIDFLGRVTEENTRLKKRNDELEQTIARLKEEKNKVEAGIISALGRLNQFEDAIERSLSSEMNRTKPPPIPAKDPFEAGTPVQEPVRPYPPGQMPAPPPVSSAYTVEEEEELEEEAEDSGEAELDIF
ncbi:MAG: cell division protein ZapB [Spirochaetaceae bacterium]|jgi:chromosome segregation ATPase|nr:cell division protein ZapB [Spirochaetaceae bacterium]